ncbi:MAG: hypothetical protein SF187_25450 [Deltaproteobacteria bacterium]|nr:hypothetical protein [Deltaproteobacteria bacterium]
MAWLAAVAGVVLFLGGAIVTFVFIDTVNRALMARPQPTYVRRFATAACLLWALVLPLFFGVAGFTWGLGRGLGSVVEGPVSRTVRGSALPWIATADGFGSKLLGRWALAKRLSETEFTLVTQTAPRWLADVLFPGDKPAPWLSAIGVSVPPAVVSVLREGLQTAPQKHPTLFGAALRNLRDRSKGDAKNRPTLKETLEAMIAPSVFHNAAQSIRDKAWHYVAWLLVMAVLVASVSAAALRLLWRSPGAAVGAAS